MAIEILMPALSPTMEVGTLAKWLVKEGDTVQSGDLLAEIETDKALMEFEAVDEGIIGKLLVAEGSENVAVNVPIALLLEDGEKASDAKTQTRIPAAAPEPLAANEAAKSTARRPKDPRSNPGPTRIFASPLARRIATDKGIDLAAITGTGPHGRIVKSDVETAPVVAAAQPARELPPSQDADAVKALYQDRAFDEVSLDGMRKIIATRLVEAKRSIPHFYLRRDIHLDTLLGIRAKMNKGLEARGVKLSVNDFIIKACARALQEVPDCNVVWAHDRILRLKPSDVAVAVAVEGGLFTPVLRDADTKSLSQLSAEMKDLAARAKIRRLAPQEYQGGSFAISNLGMMGIDNFDAVINPPHGSILAVGAGVKKPIVDPDGQLATATVMSVTLSVDHRVIDGALGAQFMAAIKTNLENPLAMLA